MFSKRTLFNTSIRAAFSNQVLRISGQRSDLALNPSICASTNPNQSQIYNILPRNIMARNMSDSNESPPSPMGLLRSAIPERSGNEKSNQSTIFSNQKPEVMNYFGDNPNPSSTLFSGNPNPSRNPLYQNPNPSSNLCSVNPNEPRNLFAENPNRSMNGFGENSRSNNSMGAERNQPSNIMGEYNSGSMNYVGRMINENRGTSYPGWQGFQRPVESNADIVHIKIRRNNTFVTLTDSKGNKKAGASVGHLAGAPKNSKNVPELTAEHVGRIVKTMGVKSVVVKVNGFLKFNRKKSAIVGLREGYTHSRGNNHPIVYIEDTTRKAHNGCRLPKQKRK